MSRAVPEAQASSAQIAVLGAGSWGTALAIQAARTGRAAVLWGRDRLQLAELSRERRNARYLPNAAFPDSLHIEPDLGAAVRASRDVLLAVPSHGLRELLQDDRQLPAGRRPRRMGDEGIRARDRPAAS